jgi:cardiolipin synthase
MRFAYFRTTAKKIFTVKNILTIPNFMSFFRIALIPFILYSYHGPKNYVVTACLVIISGLTDIADGIVARKFNMISDFGKIIDPVADKLTQAALIICLISRYKLMWAMIAVFVLKEIVIGILGYIALSRHNFMNSARWYGKVCTVAVETVIIFLVLFGHFLPDRLEMILADILIVVCVFAIIVSMILYSAFYIRIINGTAVPDEGDAPAVQTQSE